MNFDRIAVEPDKLEGKPTIRGLRISVETVVRLVAADWSFDEILSDYPDLEREDIKQALEYAAAATNVHFYHLREPA
ncbi:hypothetical protein Sru01_46440 [Sphaerisporangium rufum]|uniref:DUF433 domain-containing protein n=1 Tax=Sphaerisporangium rufum TaxID=1381558 RepID=A0A919V2F9_9ACTN|nr:DUF433 domain-containing protein [Sphaerisporangium rufum]GII79662.1 hypothetical protein Sru01_46440 [Sphaerisporangium rufum]